MKTGLVIKVVGFAVLFLASNTYLDPLFPFGPSTFFTTPVAGDMTTASYLMTTVMQISENVTNSCSPGC
jgi:hypothetical protein